MPTVDLTPLRLDLRLEYGAQAQISLALGEDVSGYSAFAGTIESPAGAFAPFDIDTSGAATGNITLTVAADTSQMATKDNRWDVQAVDGSGRTRTFAKGRVRFRGIATKPAPTGTYGSYGDGY